MGMSRPTPLDAIPDSWPCPKCGRGELEREDTHCPNPDCDFEVGDEVAEPPEPEEIDNTGHGYEPRGRR